MNGQIRDIAQRLAGLRDVLGIKIGEIASVCQVTENDYLGFESGAKDIPVSILEKISKKYNVDISALLFGDEPTMKTFFLTRAGMGTAMERTHVYKYQALACGFAGRRADPFVVTVEPSNEPMHLNSHSGQEFNLVLNGRMAISVDGHELVLNEGDSLYFDATRLHGMKALDNQSVKFLAIIF